MPEQFDHVHYFSLYLTDSFAKVVAMSIRGLTNAVDVFLKQTLYVILKI
jgi:hypothetical protein